MREIWNGDEGGPEVLSPFLHHSVNGGLATNFRRSTASRAIMRLLPMPP
jgi:hypothetical protein